MSKARQHYNLATEGEATQECEHDIGPEPAPTNWDSDERGGAKEKSPHREEKE